MSPRTLIFSLLLPALSLAAGVDPSALLERVGPSIAQVHSRGKGGAGFVFADRRHVLTARRLIWEGRSVQVTFKGGVVIEGRMLMREGEGGYAVVRLEADAPAAPLGLAEAPPSLGDEIAVVGFARGARGFAPAVASGRVVSQDEGGFSIDAAVGEENVGAPVLDPEGRVLGVAIDEADGGYALVTPSPAFAQIKPTEVTPEGGGWTLTMTPGFLMGVSTDRTMTTGFYSGFRLVGLDDQLQLDARLGLIFDDGLPVDDEVSLSREKIGMFTDLMAGYRLNLLPAHLGPLQMTLSGGVSIQQHAGAIRGLGADGRVEKRDIDESWTRPAVGLSLRMLDVVELNYTWDINTDDLGASSHRFGVGFGF